MSPEPEQAADYERVIQEAMDLWRLRYDPAVDGPTMAQAVYQALVDAHYFDGETDA